MLFSFLCDVDVRKSNSFGGLLCIRSTLFLSAVDAPYIVVDD